MKEKKNYHSNLPLPLLKQGGVASEPVQGDQGDGGVRGGSGSSPVLQVQEEGDGGVCGGSGSSPILQVQEEGDGGVCGGSGSSPVLLGKVEAGG